MENGGVTIESQADQKMTCEMFVHNIFINSPKKRENSNVTAFKGNLQPLNTG